MISVIEGGDKTTPSMNDMFMCGISGKVESVSVKYFITQNYKMFNFSEVGAFILKMFFIAFHFTTTSQPSLRFGYLYRPPSNSCSVKKRKHKFHLFHTGLCLQRPQMETHCGKTGDER